MQRKFFLDTEFREGVTQRRFFGFNIGAPVPTIDLISLGCVCEDGRELYLLNKEHDLATTWEQEDEDGEYWLRTNVLLPIYNENISEALRHHIPFTLDVMETIFFDKGRTRRDIGYQLLIFTQPEAYEHWTGPSDSLYTSTFEDEPVFFTHYGDYDWVVAMQCFGTMMEKPKSFPFLALDLQQSQLYLGLSNEERNTLCPQNGDEHNALGDARWNKRLYEALVAHEASRMMRYEPAFQNRANFGTLLEIIQWASRKCKGNEFGHNLALTSPLQACFTRTLNQTHTKGGVATLKLLVGLNGNVVYEDFQQMGYLNDATTDADYDAMRQRLLYGFYYQMIITGLKTVAGSRPYQKMPNHGFDNLDRSITWLAI